MMFMKLVTVSLSTAIPARLTQSDYFYTEELRIDPFNFPNGKLKSSTNQTPR